jgi:hypothetical protein
MRLRLFLVLLLVISPLLHGAELMFEGTPTTKVEVSNGVAQVTSLTPSQSQEWKVRIVRDRDAYLWAS